MRTLLRGARRLSPALPLALAPLAAAQTIYELPTPPNSPGEVWAASYGYALSADGQNAVGSCHNQVPNAEQPFFWNVGGGYFAMPLVPGALGGRATDISADGSTICGGTFAGNNTSPFRAWRFQGFSGMVDLGTGPAALGGPCTTFGVGMSADGNTIAATGLAFQYTAWQALRWTQSGGWLNLGTVPATYWTQSNAISGDGNIVVGKIQVNGNITYAMRWSVPSGIQNLGTLPTPLDFASESNATNADGSVVVGYSYGLSGGSRAFRWTVPDGMVDLGVPSGFGSSSALGVSSDGNAVVGSAGPGSSATLWTPTGGMVDLNAWLPTLGVNLAGWTLQSCRGVSDDNTALIGDGMYNGQQRGWVVNGLPCLAPPGVEVQPPPHPTLCEGGNVVLAAGGSGSGPFSYQWRRNGSPLADGPTGWGSFIGGSSTAIMIITSAQVADSDYYDCVISNACGGTTTSASAVTVHGAPGVVTPPTLSTACAQDHPSLSITAFSFYPMSYQWQFWNAGPWVNLADGPTGNGSTISGSASPTLTIFNASVLDTHSYRCVVTNTCGVTTPPHTNLLIDGPPVFTGTVAGPTPVCEQNSSFLTYFASATGYNTQYQWRYGIGPTPSIMIPIVDGPQPWCNATASGATTAYLTITGATPPGHIVLDCVATNACGYATSNAGGFFFAPCPCDPDANGDGIIDQADVDYLINLAAGGDNPNNFDPDFNGDGIVDQADIDALIDVVAGGDCPP